MTQKKKSLGNDLLSQGATPPVPSALASLTTGFGMGPGVPPPLESPRDFLSQSLIHLSTEDDENSKFSASQLKPSTVSTGQLNTLLCVHLPPIKPVFSRRSYLVYPEGDLILGRASHLDAFSGYLCQT